MMAFVAAFVGANNRIAGRITEARADRVTLTSDHGLVLQARPSAPLTRGDAAEAFVRPEVASLARDEAELPADQPRYRAKVESLLFDGASSAVLLREAGSGTEVRVALPQTGRFADLRVGEPVAFGFDPQRAVCFAAASP